MFSNIIYEMITDDGIKKKPIFAIFLHFTVKKKKK